MGAMHRCIQYLKLKADCTHEPVGKSRCNSTLQAMCTGKCKETKVKANIATDDIRLRVFQYLYIIAGRIYLDKYRE